ncbi:MAG: RNA methyltransferase [Desulfosalsimonas sp.]
MKQSADIEKIAIVLNRPRYPENIGAAARAMHNMGLRDLVLVNPESFDADRALTLATHTAANVVKKIRVYPDLAEALSEFGYVAGTTARLGSRRRAAVGPQAIAERLVTICENNRAAMVFGPEDRGLTNEETRLCHCLVNIPTAGFSSLNLAHSVMVICYELFKATLEPAAQSAPRLATRRELDIMYSQLKDTLLRIGFIKADNPDYRLDGFRRFFSRFPMRAGEASLIRGVCRQIHWYADKCYSNGKYGNTPDPAPGTDEDNQ